MTTKVELKPGVIYFPGLLDRRAQESLRDEIYLLRLLDFAGLDRALDDILESSSISIALPRITLRPQIEDGIVIGSQDNPSILTAPTVPMFKLPPMPAPPSTMIAPVVLDVDIAEFIAWN